MKPIKRKQVVNSAYEEKATVAIDRALEHRDDRFRALVLELTLKNKWDVDDPAFLILLSTGEMRVLMEQFPAEFEALMTRVFEQSKQHWNFLGTRLVSAAESNEQVARGVSQSITTLKQALLEERMAAQRQLRTVETALEAERAKMLRVLEAGAQQQEKVVRAQALELIAELGKQARKEGRAQVNVISKQLRRAHFWEAVAYASLAVMVWGAIAWMGGWMAHAHMQETNIWSDIRRWNGDELKACIDALTTTCNFHIQVPE